MATTHLNREHSHLPFLDGLRGLTSFWVLAGHCTLGSGLTLAVISRPQIAVDIFMFVSGFLMAYYFRVREDLEPWESPRTWWSFYIRRFFRIAPVYYVLLLVALCFRQWFDGMNHEILSTLWAGNAQAAALPPLNWRDVFTHVTFTFGFFPAYAATNVLPDWSIGLEMQFYLALPFIMLFYRRAGHFVSTVALMVIFVAAHKLFGVYAGNPPKLLGLFTQPTFLPLKLNCFLVGILLAESYYFKPQDFRKSLLLCLFSLALAAATSSMYLAGAVVVSALLMVYNEEPSLHWLRKPFVQKALHSKLCAFLADTSYNVYLIHVLVLLPASAWLVSHPWFVQLPPSARYVISLTLVSLIVYPAANLIHKFVEQPGIAMGKRLIRFQRTRAAGSPLRKSQTRLPESAT